MINKSDIVDTLNVLSPDSRESLYVLSVPNLLSDYLAEQMLLSTGKANGNAPQLIEELRSYPIWHERTIKTWVIDDDVREYALDKLNGSGNQIRQKVLTTMKEYRNELEDFSLLDLNDFDLQIARLSLGIEEDRKKGIQKFRQIFDKANKYNQQEIERVIDLYLDEKFPKSISFDQRLPEEVSNAYFMRGLYSYKNNHFRKAVHFLVPVWKNRIESYDSIKDAAISAHLVGLIWTKERTKWKEAEEAFKQSLELLEKINDTQGQGQVYHSLGNLLGRERSRWEEAEEAFKQSLALLEKINDQKGLSMVNTSYGRLLINKEDFNNAKIYLKKALDNETNESYQKGLLNLLKKIENK